MPVFNKEAPREFKLLPEDDYIFEVKECSTGLSKWPGSNGSWNCELVFEINGQRVRETLVFHKDLKWKLNNFMESCGVQLNENEPWEFNAEKAKEEKIRWINPIGLRGWCRLRVEDYVKDGKTRQANKIAVFYTNKEKLPALVSEEEVPFE